MNTKKLTVILMLAAFLGAVISLAGYKFLIEEKRYESIEDKQNYKLSNYLSDTSVVAPQGLNFIYAANASRPGVVHIKTLYEVKNSESYPQSPFDEMLKEFYGDGYEGHPQNLPPQQSAGSGVILTDDGYIVTNNHVIDKADKIEVVLNDKRSYNATLVGADPTTDLALLKIDEKGLPFVKYGNSDKVQIGEWVLAVGNPFNLTSTVTAGIVSAKARNINILRDKENLAIESFIQTDAAVNPGNSGGALVNLKGELIGINTAIATPTGTYAGYAFAVPVTLVKKVMEDLLKHGYVQRALLGVTILDLTSQVAKEKGIADINGVYVASVNEGSAADKAGIKQGDVITEINAVTVNSASELQEQVARYRPGDKIKVTYVRGGKKQEAETVLRNKMGETGIVKKEDVALRTILGAQLREASKEELEKFKLEKGVKVVKVNPGKFKDIGIPDGFIITSVDKKPVDDPNDVDAIIQDTKVTGTLIGGVMPNGQRKLFALGE
ncbi:MAG: Do family serine endopeptidase [Cytophagaceae bacterium]|nr:Do family serine endopeptidase [Cytophagaceae bacterium]